MQDFYPGDRIADVDQLVHLSAIQAARHLFRVASGLESMVVGETEIFGQVKRAYETAMRNGTTGKFLNRLFQKSFEVGKQVRATTGITRGSVSVGSVAVDLAEQIFGNLNGSKVMILGAGETRRKRRVLGPEAPNRSSCRIAPLNGLRPWQWQWAGARSGLMMGD